DRPLWSIDVVEPLLDGRVAAIWRIHHAMADGGAAMSIGSAVLWRDSPEPEPAPPLPPPEPMPASASLLAALARDRARRLARDFKRVGAGLASSERRRESLLDLRRAPAT